MDKNVQEPVKLFQYNTLGALMAGLYGGTMTVGELLEHGDLGLGTLDSIDGESWMARLIRQKDQEISQKLWKYHQMPSFLTLQ